jgi:hypothetical protein
MGNPAAPRPLVFRPPFVPAEESPASLTSLMQTWNLHDDAVRRFSEPAPDAVRQSLAAHISSAKAAYLRAIQAILQSTKSEEAKAFLEECTEKDLETMAINIQRAQSAICDKSKVEKFIEVLHHYHGVFDILSRGGLPYLALIWGGMKLILVVSRCRDTHRLRPVS